jgi:GGDEF domain-containing protein
VNTTLVRALKAMTGDEIYEALYTDSLTGVQNRRAFEVDTDWSRVAIVDMDSLKWLNDTSGHRLGDKHLQKLAFNLSLVFGADNVFRLSGDEFAVVSRGNKPWGLSNGMDHLHTYIPEFSYGEGATLEAADAALRADKAARELAGLRAPRGEQPPWIA